MTDDTAVKQSQRLTALESQVSDLKQQLESDRNLIKNQFDQVDVKLQAVSSDLSLSLKSALDQQSKDLMASFGKLIGKGGSTPNSRDAGSKRERSPSPMASANGG